MDSANQVQIEATSVVFDACNQTLTMNGRRRQLSPKEFAVLEHLFQRPGQLVTKDELLDHAWPDVCVVEGVLKNVVRGLREALDDDARSPRFIETVHRRGYRYIGGRLLSRDLANDSTPPDRRTFSATLCPLPVVDSLPAARVPTVVGRDAELHVLRESWALACAGQPQAVVVYGDPGIGKTTLIEEWLRREQPAQAGANIVVTRCAPSGSQHPYVGFLDALKASCEGALRDTVLAAAARYAPGWLKLAPWLSSGDEPDIASHAQTAFSSGSLLLEAVALLEAIAAEQPLLLWFDDVHLCDPASRDILMMVRRRCAAVRLMLVVTTCRWHPCRSPEVFEANAHASMAAWRKVVLNHWTSLR